MIKRREADTPTSCWNKARMDEPLFVLRAKDRLAPIIVRLWARFAKLFWYHEDWKIQEAYLIATEMENWRKEHGKTK